jgi:hypothetical protein
MRTTSDLHADTAGTPRQPVVPRSAATAREPRLCIRCGAPHAARRISAPGWTDARACDALVIEWHVTLCPHCQMVSTEASGGEVLLVGAFVSEHQAEIERLIRGEASRALADDPHGRILRLERPQRGRLTVTTSTDVLARRIGQALHDAHRGTVHCEAPRERLFARVTWVRDE